MLSFLKFFTHFNNTNWSFTLVKAYKHGGGLRAQARVNGKRKSKAGFSTKRDVMAWAVNEERLTKESAFPKASCRSSHLILPNLEKISLRVLCCEYCVPNISDSSGLLG